ncbi:O-methyltransferase [Marinibaculum pumilum]|uniref:O-methyltransferase n=1 Tax=Marinibaculum pumilum TaxID=1766165 RepID=A0ABV7KVH8_9PROT
MSNAPGQPPACTAVDDWFAGLFLPPNPALDAALEANAAAGLPPHDISPLQGAFLQLLARIAGARRILEIGTLGGTSTIWLARALPADGCLVTLEADPAHAAIARANIAAAGVAGRVVLRQGAALMLLPQVEADRLGPFDLVFIDADKPNNPHYLDWALRLARPGTVILADNVVRDGAVLDAASADDRVQGVRRFAEMVAAEPRLTATAIQTVGAKGWDGFVLAVVA